MTVQIHAAVQLHQHVLRARVGPHDDVERSVGHDGDVDGILPCPHVRATNDIATSVHAAAILERVEGIETAVAIAAVGAGHVHLRDLRTAVAEHDHIAPAGAARLRPLIGIGHVTAAWHLELNGPAARCERLRADINFAVHRIRIVLRVLRVRFDVRGEPHEQLRAGAILARRIRLLHQHRAGRKTDNHALAA